MDSALSDARPIQLIASFVEQPARDYRPVIMLSRFDQTWRDIDDQALMLVIRSNGLHGGWFMSAKAFCKKFGRLGGAETVSLACR